MNKRMCKKRAKPYLGVVLPPLTEEQRARLLEFSDRFEREYGPFEPPRFVLMPEGLQ